MRLPFTSTATWRPLAVIRSRFHRPGGASAGLPHRGEGRREQGGAPGQPPGPPARQGTAPGPGGPRQGRGGGRRRGGQGGGGAGGGVLSGARVGAVPVARPARASATWAG